MDRETVLTMYDGGMFYAEIGSVFGVSRQAVYDLLTRTGGVPKTPRHRAKNALPWDIHGEMVNAAQYQNILRHLEAQQGGLARMSKEKRRKLRGFYRTLSEHNVVVRFDPSLPPLPGQAYGGFEYVPRKESDGNLIVRVDKHTKLPRNGRELWALPAEEDWPQ